MSLNVICKVWMLGKSCTRAPCTKRSPCLTTFLNLLGKHLGMKSFWKHSRTKDVLQKEKEGWLFLCVSDSGTTAGLDLWRSNFNSQHKRSLWVCLFVFLHVWCADIGEVKSARANKSLASTNRQKTSGLEH